MKRQYATGTETKRRVIRAAADLFHKQGVRATSPDQVIEASGIGKGQFYHYFKSKEGLVHEVLQAHLEAIRTSTSPVNYEIETWHDLEQWFMAHVELRAPEPNTKRSATWRRSSARFDSSRLASALSS